ncbi:hexokinase [Coemansia sp. BCRC 34962]|nr:hexokinase [Coemansia sp. BCRC 34962]
MTVVSTLGSALSHEQCARLSQIEQEFALSTDQLHTIVKHIRADLSLGLKRDNDSTLSMTPSFVHQRTLPLGTSLGMGIEASGRIRITRVNFADDSTIAHTSTQVFIAPRKSMGEFYEYTAFCLREFIQTQGLEQEILPLGITIGLPVRGEEDSLGLGGKNMMRRFYDTFLKGHLPVRLTSVTNGAVSRLVAARHGYKAVGVAASFNRGVSAAYFERLGCVERLGQASENEVVAVDTEIGRFYSTTLPLTQWDRRVDRESKYPGTRVFEKLVADQYLGEITRNLITDLMDERLLFAKAACVETISTEYAFYTAYMAPIVESSDHVGGIMENEFGIATTEADRLVVQALCRIVARRAALLAGAMLAALVKGKRAVALSGALLDVNEKLRMEAVDTMKGLLEDMDVEVLFQHRGAEALGAAINAASF